MNPEKKIQIELSKDVAVVESNNISRYENVSDFPTIYKKLQDNGIDVFSSTTKFIKKEDGAYYIAKEVGKQNIGYLIVKDSQMLKSLISNITKQNTSVLINMGGDIHDQAVVDIFPTSEGKEELILTMKKELADLQKQVITFEQIDKASNLLLVQYQELRKKLELSKMDPPKERKDNPIYQNNLGKLLDVVKTQKTHIEDIQKKSAVQRVSAFQQNTPTALAEWKSKLDYIHAQFSSIDSYWLNPDHAISNDVDITAYNIDTPLYQVKDVEKLLKRVSIQREEIRNMNATQFNLDLSKIDSDEQQRLRMYLNGVLTNTIDPAKEKFTPTKKETFEGLLAQHTWLKAYFTGETYFATADNKKGTGEYVPTNEEVSDEQFQKEIKNNPHYADMNEAFRKGGLGGLAEYGLDQTNMTPEQKQMRGGVGKLALTAGMVFVGWKMLKSAFNLITGAHKGDGDKETAARRKDRAWLLGPAAIVFASQAVTGEGPMGLIKGGKGSEMLMDLISGKKSGGTGTPEQQKKNAELVSTYGEGFPGLTAVFHGLTYGQIKGMVEKKDGNIKLTDNAQQELLNLATYGGPDGKGKNAMAKEFLATIGKKDDQHMIDLAFKGMGITRETLQDDTNKDKKFDETASLAIIKLNTVYAFMENKGYNKLNPDNISYIEKYIADENTTVDDLEKLEQRGDIFLKETVTDKTGQNLGERVKLLAKGDIKKEEGLLIGLNKFYEYMPNASKKIELIGDGPEISFRTYGQETKVNIDKKELVGFTPSPFESFFELFKAASLTNRIKDLCKDKAALTPAPFYISQVGGDITFDNAEILSTEFDTEILTGGIRGELENISPVLEKYKKEYCDYLNKTTPKFWKEAPAQ